MTNGVILANLVILNRASEKSKSALLFEGDKDGRVFRKVVDSQYCRPFASENRAIAVDALRILKSAGERGVLAIVDADTDHLRETKSVDPDLILTHTRDLEGILLQSPALRQVLIEFDLEGKFGATPEIAVIMAVAPLGCTRFIAERNRWTIRLSELDFSRFVDPVTLACNTDQLCNHMSDLTITTGITADHYRTELDLLLAKRLNPYKVARGHDATSLLAWAISVISGRKRKDGARITSQVLESFLRTAYREDSFSECELYKEVEHWEERNTPYRVLKRG